MKGPQRAGLIVNCIGRQCTMILHSMGITLDKPKTVFHALEGIFRPEANQTLSRLKFRSLKQKQSQTCDAYMSELRYSIVECKYPHNVADQLLKDQFIFGASVKEIQDHLLGEIKPKDTSAKCLLEFCKIESKIEQRKLLGIKTTMTYAVTYQGFCGRDKSCGKSRNCSSTSSGRNCKYCGRSHIKANCPAFGKKCQKCRKR